jgi:hypothetical protein
LLENLLNAAFVSAGRCSISQWPVSAKVIDVTSSAPFYYHLQTIASTLRSKIPLAILIGL